MYGLKQAAVLAYSHIKETPAPHDYESIEGITSLWKPKSRRISFRLCADHFGIKYFDKKDVLHLLDKIESIYSYTTDWSGKNYCRFKLIWNYEKG